MLQTRKDKARLVFVSSLGGGFEMYDFVIYIFFADIISKLFFPQYDSFAAVLLTFGIFAAGYLARPLGALIFGHYGDKVGRRKGLIVSIVLMASATTLIGLVPTHQQIGDFAPIILFLFRLLQGVAVGGDLPGAITFVSENAAVNERGLFCGWVYLGVNVGILLGSFVGMVLTASMSVQALTAWGWRLAFLFSFLLLWVGLYFRRRMSETPIYQEIVSQHELAKKPILELLHSHNISNIVKGVGLVWLFAVDIAQIFLYTPSYLHTHIHDTLRNALFLNTGNLILFSAFIPIMGRLSDRIGRKRVLLMAGLYFLLFSYPSYLLIDGHHEFLRILALGLFGIMSASLVGVIPAVLGELFSTKYRYSGVALSYNIGFALFAGLTPLVATFLIKETRNIASLSYNLMLGAVVLLITLFFTRETSNLSLRKV